MPTKVQNLIALPSQHGLNSAIPRTFLAIDELSAAENIYYGQAAERKKRLGTAAYNASAIISSTTNVRAFADFWRHGTALAPTQTFVSVAGASIFQSTGGGAWSAITASSSFGLNASQTTNITIGEGYAVFSDGVSTPSKWDQTTYSLLQAATSGPAPIFTACVYHLNRLWAVGMPGQTISTGSTGLSGGVVGPSTLVLSAGGDITVWSGADVISFDVDKDDGDRIIGISKPFHKRVYLFKGPSLGSIHEIAGNTLSTLTKDKIFTGLPLQNHKGLVTTTNDIFWISKYGIHSLNATQKYGDTEMAFLSLPIQDVFQNDLDLQQIENAVGYHDPYLGVVGWFVTPSGQTTNQWALVYHYLLSDPSPQGKKYWSVWKFTGLAGFSAGTAVTPSGQAVGPGITRVYMGNSDGKVYAMSQPTQSDAGTNAYLARIRTGIIMNMGQGLDPLVEKQFFSITTFFDPVGTYTHDLNINVDNRAYSSTIVMAGVGDTLG